MNMKAPVLESLFNKVAGLNACNFIKKRFQHSFSLWILRTLPVFYRTPIIIFNTRNTLQSTIICKIFWDFFMFYQIFLSPQVKRWAIITYKHGNYNLRKLRNIRRVPKPHKMIAQCPAPQQIENPANDTDKHRQVDKQAQISSHKQVSVNKEA